MRDFVDVLMADTELARQFRQRYSLLILPLLNPDGVANGHWRHNAAETDLNRDWGIFTQAETLAVERLLQGLEKRGTRPRLMLDFHATKFTDTAMFYTQAAGEKTDPENFDINWFANVRARLPGFDFKHDPRPSCINPNTKGYFYRNYGIPAFTYEIADEADRDTLHATTPVFAEEMMRELLRAK
jgi:predicted deacylase